MAERTLEEKAFGEDTKGRYAWMLSNPVPMEVPILAGGTLGLWDYYPQ
jgi:activating signal cointegrator 1